MKRLVVLGGGESGVGAAILGQKEGFDVFLSDRGTLKEKYEHVLKQYGIAWEAGGHSEDRILMADLVVKSPGIPDHVPLIVTLREHGIPVISEIEFGARYTDATLVAITGSNGKTTTTMITYHLLREAGLNVGMAGNIGDSFARMVAEKEYDYYVLEVSSFQLDGIATFAPAISVITNITEDHLDRYEYKFEKYIAAKFRIAENQHREDHFVYDADDEVITGWMAKHPVQPRALGYSLESEEGMAAWVDEKNIWIKTDNETITMEKDLLTLEGKHNLKNTMAAATVAKLVGIRKETIRASIQNFQGAPHRLEKVLKIHHVEYINDSKATNVNATYYALDSMTGQTIWIVGGVDKGNEYQPLMPLVREKVKAIICLGVDNEKILDAFGNAVDLMVQTTSMTEAVKLAYRISERGDTVLLSPACASFDLFENYEDRGNQFKEAVKNL